MEARQRPDPSRPSPDGPDDEQRRNRLEPEARDRTEPDAEPDAPEPRAPVIARVRDDDLEPHDGLRYIARLFKALALLLVVMTIAEVVIGIQQDGAAALGVLLVELTRLVVFAGLLWGAGDLAVLLIESNHDLRATRILVGRLDDRVTRALGADPDAPGGPPARGPRDVLRRRAGGDATAGPREPGGGAEV